VLSLAKHKPSLHNIMTDPDPTDLSSCRAARTTAVVAAFPAHDNLVVSGRDRIAFLQNLITNDLGLLTPTQGIYSLLLTAKGKIVADFFVYPLPPEGSSDSSRHPDSLLIEVAWASAATIKSHLLGYRFRAQVKIEMATTGKILVAGPGAASLLVRFFDAPLPALAERGCVQMGEIFCIRRSVTGEADYLLYLPAAQAAEVETALLAFGKDNGVTSIGPAALETLRIEAGLPRFGVDIDEQTFPAEAGLNDAVSETKGCYPGQEVVARIDTYGHVNKHLRGLVFAQSSDPLPQKSNLIFHEGQEVGRITSATISPHLNRGIALGFLRTVASAPETAVEVEIGDARSPARVVLPPFYPRSK